MFKSSLHVVFYPPSSFIFIHKLISNHFLNKFISTIYYESKIKFIYLFLL